eukprot:CCRYP_015007-RB/>CCRYP_015007-RB protein AED:0.27 eAED:1.00 QI:0/-1/0/1/-1/0/1/0/61
MLHSAKSAATKKAQIFLSTRCHSSTLHQVPIHISLLSIFRRLLCWLFKNLWKHSASDYLRM